MKRRTFIKKAILLGAGLALPKVLLNCTSDVVVDPEQLNAGKKILVIGAGIAGLSAAASLADSGFDVQVMEASGRYGGRIKSVDFEGFTADHGASWIHGINGNPLYSLANDNAIQTTPTYYDPSRIFDVDGTEITQAEWDSILPYLDDLADIAYSHPDASLEDILGIIAPQLPADDKLIRLFYGAVRSEIEIPYAVDAKDISAKALLIEDSFPGDDVVFPSGMQQLTDVLARGLNIIYNTFVTKIDYSGEKVRVFATETSNVPADRSCNACHNQTNAISLPHTKVYEAERVVVALPIEMIKRENVVFYPPLPQEKKNALQNLQMGTMNKVFLKFDNRFWDDTSYFFEPLKTDYSRIVEFFNAASVGNHNVLIAFLAGYHAKSIESMNDTEVTEMIMQDLRQMFGNSIPQPVAMQRTAWHTQSLSLGCYPHLVPGGNINACDVLFENIDQKIFFAGDYTSKKYMATTHGAFLSGKKAAYEISKTWV